MSSLPWMSCHRDISYPTGVSASPLVTIATGDESYMGAQLEKLVPGTASHTQREYAVSFQRC